jgi:peptidyl-prolyl isomerase E (cyclophilin E)
MSSINKKILYVGGLSDDVDEKILKEAFASFGEVNVQIPLDYQSGKHRGFGFVEFDSTEDAAYAVDNMVTIKL